MKLNKYTLANTLAITTGILWVLCALFVTLLPKLSLQITSLWLHGLTIDTLGSWNMTLAGFGLGGLLLILSAWISGYTFGWVLDVQRKSGD